MMQSSYTIIEGFAIYYAMGACSSLCLGVKEDSIRGYLILRVLGRKKAHVVKASEQVDAGAIKQVGVR